MQISIQTVVGQVYNLTVEKSSTILSIKNQLMERINIDASQIRIVFKGKQLNDEMTVENCNIDPGDKLHMILNLQGGTNIIENKVDD
mmetsp:Transcript_40907/g.34470  ORF Transcript_40907/g.34470 Transcript_40907/m.34470 type:complete len:87 (+) Transcript_40907:6-266(+)